MGHVPTPKGLKATLPCSRHRRHPDAHESLLLCSCIPSETALRSQHSSSPPSLLHAPTSIHWFGLNPPDKALQKAATGITGCWRIVTGRGETPQPQDSVQLGCNSAAWAACQIKRKPASLPHMAPSDLCTTSPSRSLKQRPIGSTDINPCNLTHDFVRPCPPFPPPLLRTRSISDDAQAVKVQRTRLQQSTD